MIYAVDGQELTGAYSSDGQEITAAYDSDGYTIWESTVIEPDFYVMTYNTGDWYTGIGQVPPADKEDLYYALQNTMIGNADADIACFNEYRYTMGASGASAETFLSQWYDHIHAESGSSSYYGRAIASKYPMTDYTVRTYTGESRYFDSAVITVNNIPITVIVTHLTTASVAARKTEAEELLSYLATLDRFMVFGDLNTINATDKNGDDYIEIIKPFLDAGYKCANNTSTFGFLITYSDAPSGSAYLCLDNVITSPNIKICNVRVDTTKLHDSLDGTVDHMPLIVGIKLL